MYSEHYGEFMVFAEQPPDGDAAPDPEVVHTTAEFGRALNALRGSRSYSALTAAAVRQPARDGRRSVLSRSTLSDLVNGRCVPSWETVLTFLIACEVGEVGQGPWRAAWERVRTSHQRRPAGAGRVHDADLRRLGVHAWINAGPGGEQLLAAVPPAYVLRDRDAELRAAIAEAGRGGGFVLLCGGSSVGKTRMLAEAVTTELPDWWLLHPADAGAVRRFADAPTARTVVWLDELQNYLEPRGSLPAGMMRALLVAGLVVVATLWPHEYGLRTALPADEAGVKAGDPYAVERELLRLAQVIDVDTVNAAERRRAEALAGDPRIRVALDVGGDTGLTEVLAAGPELVRWWRHADATVPRQRYGRAVITAALDARRFGAHQPLTREFLIAAAPAYLTDAQRATAGPDWFEQAIEYATTPRHGAASCLTAQAGPGMGEIAGYTTADYLHQQARAERRAVPLTEAVWDALIVHHHHDDTTRLAENASKRDLRQRALSLYLKAAEAGVAWAEKPLAKLLFDRIGQDTQAFTGPS